MDLAQIIIANSSQSFSGKLDSLTYEIPEELQSKICIGSFVLVPFGKQVANGLVIDIKSSKTSKAPEFKIREIEDLISDEAIYEEELVELIKHAAEYYASNYEEVLNAALPAKALKKPEKEITLLKSDLIERTNIVLSALEKARGQKAKFSRLKTLTNLTRQELQKQIGKLEKEGKVSIAYMASKKRKTLSKNPIDRLSELAPEQIPELTQDQEIIVNFIKSTALRQPSPKFLIHGVTGSGKTEIYMRLIEDTFKKNKSSIFLVPEISLAPQVVERLAQRFGKENVLVWHSALSESEKNHSWDELMTGDPKVVVGARSAIWSPIKDLGLIVVDEEHENSYKQDSPAPRYDARPLAIKRAELNDCPIVFGSATPSIEIYYKAQSKSEAHKDFHLLELKDRIFKNPLPTVHVVDMREEFLQGNSSIFARQLKEQMEKALERKEQIILFLNRRGFASHVFCRTCGYVYECKHCESKMVYHEDIKLLTCHHCGLKEAHPKDCPECSMPTIKFFGLGTQKLVAETKYAFPEAKIERLDSDTSKIKHNYIKVLQAFKEKKIDILIGTQMVAKGLDLVNVSTVGVISADGNFSQLDYQAEERGFQLLTQVAGRAGRGDIEGHAFFQTYQPERTVLLTAQEQDFPKFYEKEIKDREEFEYPPFSTLVRFVSGSEDMAQAIETANSFHEKIYTIENIQVLGPCPCAIPKLSNKYRQHLLVKIPRDNKLKLDEDLKHNNALQEIKTTFKEFKAYSGTNFTIDIDNNTLY